MATASTLPVPKRRNQVYGKVSSRAKWTVNSFFDDDDELRSSDALPTTLPRHSTEIVKRAERKTALDTTVTQASRPLPTRHDTFDIPSSDDEQVISLDKHVSPRTFHKRATLVDDANSNIAQLAPWEKSRADQQRQEGPAKKAKPRSTGASPEAQLRQDLKRALSSPQALKSDTTSLQGKSPRPVGKSRVANHQNLESEQSSAMARLAARRNDVGLQSSKRHAVTEIVTQNSPRKRPRTASEPEGTRSSSPSRTSTDDSRYLTYRSNETDTAMDVYDISESSGDVRSGTKPKRSSPKSALNRAGRHGKLTTYVSHKALQNGASAPSDLNELLTDADPTKAPTRSPSAPSRCSTPQKLPSTPSRDTTESPDAFVKVAGTMTPKQVQLWHDLLPSDTVAPSPSGLPLNRLMISGQCQSGVSQRNLSKSYSGAPRRRTRLVDKLKASAPKAHDMPREEEWSYENGDQDECDSNVEMGSDARILPDAAPQSDRPTLTRHPSSQMSQTQRAVAAQSGPRITYGQSRSYLQDDSLGHDLMASLGADTSRSHTQAKRVGGAVPNSQKSSFDLDDSGDDNAGAGKIRTIHELRAAGRNVSGMYDIEELFGEIQNHSISHRGRRRSALIDLASKLTDKAFAQRFTAQSLEIELASECGADSDIVADFVLASAIALILVNEPTLHTLRSFKENGIISWLAQLLDQEVEICKVAKNRQNNMSKVAQSSLLDFSESLRKQTTLWTDVMPTTMTIRLVALKALDQLVSKLRRSGERAELLGHDQIAGILFIGPGLSDPSSRIELDLVVSVLEALSISTSSLSWSSSTIHSLADLLPLLDASSSTQRHSVFLMLRLCLNLTNDNVQNCRSFSTSPAIVPYFVQSIGEAFAKLDTIELANEQERVFALDLLVLSMGILINLTEHSNDARQQALRSADGLSSLISIFQQGQKHMEEAESVEESVTNVAFGYLAVVLANLCLDPDARCFIADRLPGKTLATLVEAVDEFVSHHSKVDTMNFEGEEGMEVWSAFTEKLRMVLARLREPER